MKHFFLSLAAIVLFSTSTVTAQNINDKKTDSLFNTFKQDIEKLFVDKKINNWQLYEHTIYESYPDSIQSKLDFERGKEFLNLNRNGEYLSTLRNTFSKGVWLQNNNLIVLKQKVPKTIDVYYEILKLNDSTLQLKKNNKVLTYVSSAHSGYLSIEAPVDTIIPSQGFSIHSLWRGILGMITLIFIAFVFSNNRKAINWKIVGIGLAFQLVIAIGVLKVSFIKNGFEAIGQVFINILDFTRAGSEFLFSGVMDVSSYGFIFAFQVLPTIIFFSALTSVLFYLGIIQKVVQAMAWLLSKALKISGAESLSVAGNIFLGQTEAPLLIKAYLEKMNKSEILLVMIGGMATVAGAVLAAYIGFLGGDDPGVTFILRQTLISRIGYGGTWCNRHIQNIISANRKSKYKRQCVSGNHRL